MADAWLREDGGYWLREDGGKWLMNGASVVWSWDNSSHFYTLSSDGLTATRVGGGGSQIVKAGLTLASGYFTVTPTIAGGNTVVGFTDLAQSTADYVGDTVNSIGYASDGNIYNNGPSIVAGLATYTSADVIKAEISSGKFFAYKNGTLQNAGGTTLPVGLTSPYPAASGGGIGDVLVADFTGWVAGATVAPSSGHLTFGGKVSALSLALNQTTGHLTYGGKVPSVSVGTNVSPPVAHLAFTGHQPSVTLTTAVAPSVAHLSFGGKVPTVTRITVLSATAGHLAFGGKTATVVLGVNVFPSVGHLSLGGKVSTVTFTFAVSASVGHLAFGGKVPTTSVSSGLLPSTGHMAFVGKVPTLTTTLNPATGQLGFSGHLSALDLALGPNTGHIAFNGYVPTYGPGALGHIKVDLGSFVAKPIKVWNGSAWVEKPLKYWTGTVWRATGY